MSWILILTGLMMAAALPVSAAGNESFSGSDDEWAALRRNAARRRRRVIMNHDGNIYDKSPARAEEERNAENFLQPRVTPLVESGPSHVDAVFYCTGVPFAYTHYSEVSELRVGDEFNWAWELAKTDRDDLTIMADFCRRHGMEIFWSMRMNDAHDVSARSIDELNEWKRNNPGSLMGKREDRHTFSYGGRRWSALDYSCPKVHDQVLAVLRDVAERYPVDGLELDFFRSPVYFRPQMTGGEATGEHRAMMTGLLRRVFEMSEEVGRHRGRPLLIAVRVPDSIDYARAVGLDWEAWMREGIVDLVTVSGLFRLEPWETGVERARPYGVPLYAGLSESRLRTEGEDTTGSGQGAKGRERQCVEVYRARALNAWKAGVDGIYTFNLFNPRSQVFRDIGDPELLESRDKTYTTGARNIGYTSSWMAWLKDIERFANRPYPLPERPRDLLPGFPVTVYIPVGEEARDEQRWELWAEIPGFEDASLLAATANGREVSEGKSDDGWIKFELDAESLVEGSNRFEIVLCPHAEAASRRLTDLVVWVFNDSEQP